MRIVSLLPSATEIVCALGAENDLVGISHECDYPEAIRHLPRVTSTSIDSGAPSPSIHQSVAERLKGGLSLYRVNESLLKDLKPDLIITQDQCQVCAVSLDDVSQAVCTALDRPVQICSLSPNTLEEVVQTFARVGEAIDCIEESARLIERFRQGLAAVEEVARNRKRPRVACIEWIDPIMIAGHWTPELVRIAGGDPVIVEHSGPFRTVRSETLEQAAPEVIVILPCGFSLTRALDELEHSRDRWSRLADATDASIFVTDGNLFFNRSGPRLLESAEILSAVFDASPSKSPYFDRHRPFIRAWKNRTRRTTSASTF